MTDAQDSPSITSKTSLLAIIPGFMATIGLANGSSANGSSTNGGSASTGFIDLTVPGGMLLAGFVAAAWITNRRRLPAWSLMSVGILLGLVLPTVFGILGAGLGLATGTNPSPSASLFTLALPWSAIVGLALFLKQSRETRLKTWLLTAAIVVCSILVRVKYFALFGVSWSVFWELSGVSLWAAGTLLLPIFMAGVLARRYKAAAVIFFAVGATYVWYQVLIDNAYHVSIGLNNPGLYWLYRLVVQLLFMVVGPLLYLYIKNPKGKMIGLIGAITASVVINILFSGLVRGDFTPIIWLAAVPYTLSVGLSFGLVNVLKSTS